MEWTLLHQWRQGQNGENQMKFFLNVWVPSLLNKQNSEGPGWGQSFPSPAYHYDVTNTGMWYSTHTDTDYSRKVSYGIWRQNNTNTSHQMMLHGLTETVEFSNSYKADLRTRKKYRQHSHLVKFSYLSLAFEFLCWSFIVINPIPLYIKVNSASFYHFYKSI